MPTADYYQSIWTGQQIDDGLGKILNGDVDSLVNQAKSAAQSAQTSSKAAQASAEKAQAATAHGPKIGSNGNWLVWNQSAGAYQDSGVYSKGQKGDKGDRGPKGEKGEQGPKGDDGVIVDLDTGVFAMSVSEEGHLLVSVNVDEQVPPLEINEDTGHLVYKIIT